MEAGNLLSGLYLSRAIYHLSEKKTSARALFFILEQWPYILTHRATVMVLKNDLEVEFTIRSSSTFF